MPKAEVILAPNRGQKQKLKFLLHPHRYTPDFLVKFSRWGLDLMIPQFPKAAATVNFCDHGYLWVDTKGGFTVQRGQDQVFQANRKLMWHKKSLWVEKIICWSSQCDRWGNPKVNPKKCLFVDTYCPREYLLSSTGKPTAMAQACITVQEFIEHGKSHR